MNNKWMCPKCGTAAAIDQAAAVKAATEPLQSKLDFANREIELACERAQKVHDEDAKRIAELETQLTYANNLEKSNGEAFRAEVGKLRARIAELELLNQITEEETQQLIEASKEVI